VTLQHLIDPAMTLSSKYAIVFSLETSFQRLARRPGGLPRQQALRFRRAAPPPAATVRPAPPSGYLAVATGFRLD